ncbi:DUF3806 domain-containing protein [Oleiagrimonas sp. C23AA]|uniref:DUF3806 domain-containing protein n=1 Tax=Oleiagrimonas sp. C23AA TaxID=2719047 RepID=UPI00141DC179|nr:DUF3806 domain-containing protein [Oleiagrimonas sp. C23AA]NII10138.1 DUF3806 domain-containing protein [Oleiagrimonas sp. C23AA]
MDTQPQYKERQLEADEAREVSVFAKDGRKTAKVGYFTNDSAKIVSAVDTHVNSLQRAIHAGSLTLNEQSRTYLSLQLGCLWGQQLIKQFGWEWVCVIDGDSELYAVVSKDRALMMLPTYFVNECLQDPNVDCTSILSFNMIAAQKFSETPSGSYLNILDIVVRIVPRHLV